MKKTIASLLSVAVLVGGCLAVGCKDEPLDKMTTYVLSDSILDMYIEVPTANVTITLGEECYVESDVKNIEISDDNGCLSVIAQENAKGAIKIYLPDITLGSVNATVGTGKLDIVYLDTEDFVCTLGAGDALFRALCVSDNAEVIAGTGNITVTQGIIGNLDMTLGTGEFSFTGGLVGNSMLTCGIGNVALQLQGTKSIYCIEVDKGAGKISVGGTNAEDGALIGSGSNFVSIVGGAGDVSVEFVAIGE